MKTSLSIITILAVAVTACETRNTPNTAETPDTTAVKTPDTTAVKTPDTTVIVDDPSLAVVKDSTMLPLLFPDHTGITTNLTAGDGVISICIDNNKSYWLWGDFFLGEVRNNKRISGTQLISGNALSLLDGTQATTYFGGTPQNPQAFLSVEPTINGYRTIVWPGHGFVKNGIVHIFMSVFLKVGSGSLDIEFHSTQYYRLNQSDLSFIDVQELETSRLSAVHFGYGIVEHEGYYYTYGTKDLRNAQYPPCVARAQLVNDKLQNWEVFDGTAWSADPTAAVAMSGLNSIMVSEQHSVFKYENKFILLTQSRMLGQIYTFVADRPEGPWSNKKTLYTTPERSDKRYRTYNAMAHPQYAVGDKLLVSYCVNSTTYAGLNSDVMSYRPRFIWVPYSLILQ